MSYNKHRKITTNYTSSLESFEITAEGEKSSNSAAFSLARATTLSGKFANSATWIPKLWSQAPGSTWKKILTDGEVLLDAVFLNKVCEPALK